MRGTVNIKGGYFHTSKDADGTSNECILLASTRQKATLNISGGIFDNEGGEMCINVLDSDGNGYKYNTVNITGGTFIGFDPADGDKGAGIDSFIDKDKYQSVKQAEQINSKDVWVVSKK